uniref:Uncharacterized protein n=1 Tax=Compsopogon caeruleus TaxID=31354 RepID=A0A7S1TF42_9RHOD
MKPPLKTIPTTPPIHSLKLHNPSTTTTLPCRAPSVLSHFYHSLGTYQIFLTVSSGKNHFPNTFSTPTQVHANISSLQPYTPIQDYPGTLVPQLPISNLKKLPMID